MAFALFHACAASRQDPGTEPRRYSSTSVRYRDESRRRGRGAIAAGCHPARRRTGLLCLIRGRFQQTGGAFSESAGAQGRRPVAAGRRLSRDRREASHREPLPAEHRGRAYTGRRTLWQHGEKIRRRPAAGGRSSAGILVAWGATLPNRYRLQPDAFPDCAPYYDGAWGGLAASCRRYRSPWISAGTATRTAAGTSSSPCAYHTSVSAAKFFNGPNAQVDAGVQQAHQEFLCPCRCRYRGQRRRDRLAGERQAAGRLSPLPWPSTIC